MHNILASFDQFILAVGNAPKICICECPLRLLCEIERTWGASPSTQTTQRPFRSSLFSMPRHSNFFQQSLGWKVSAFATIAFL